MPDWLDKYKKYNKTWDYSVEEQKPIETKKTPVFTLAESPYTTAYADPSKVNPKSLTSKEAKTLVSGIRGENRGGAPIVGEQERERESRLLNALKGVKTITETPLDIVSAPAKGIIQGVTSGYEGATKAGQEIKSGNIIGGLLGAVNASAETFMGVLNSVPMMAMFTTGLETAKKAGLGKVTEKIMQPASTAAEWLGIKPENYTEEQLLKLGDLTAVLGGMKVGRDIITGKSTPQEGLTNEQLPIKREVQNAIKERQIAESNINQYQGTPEIGQKTTETGGGNRTIESGKIKEEINPFESWLKSQPDVELVKKPQLGITGKGEKIGAFTQKVGDKYKVTVADYSPETSYAKEIGRVLANKVPPEELRTMMREYANLGYNTGTIPNDFAASVKEVLTKPDARKNAPLLTEYLKSKNIPFTDISENPIGVPESITAKARREISSEFESPIKGISHFKSFEKFTNDKQLNSYLEGLGKSDKSRGILTKDIVDDLASQLGIKQSDVLKIKTGETRNVEWLRGAKQVIADNILEMDKFRKSREGATLTKDEAKDLKKMYLTHLSMISKVKGLATETGRALQEMNRPVSAREFDVLNEIKKQLEESGEPTETVLARMTKNEKIRTWVMEGLNLPRVALTSFDLSMPFRQGKLLMLTNPKAGLKNFKEMHKSAFSEKHYQEIEQNLKSRPNASLYEKTDLFLTERDPIITRQGSTEEVFYGNKLAEHVPLLGEIVKGSERGAAAFMNLMRADTFDMFADKLKASGITYENNPKLYKDIAWMIDKMSMRGDIGKAERVSGILNSIFFSIRNQTAKFQLLTSALTGRKILDPRKGQPTEYYKLDPMVRKEIMKTAAKDIGFTMGVLSVASLLGGQVEIDPRSSDFLKIKIGKTRIDPWAGWQQYVVLGTQLALDEKKNLQTGKISSSKKFPFETRLDKLTGFARKKLAPTTSIPVDLLAGKDVVGQPVTPLGELKKVVSPMALSDFYDSLNELGLAGTFAGLYGLYGGGVQTYNNKKR